MLALQNVEDDLTKFCNTDEEFLEKISEKLDENLNDIDIFEICHDYIKIYKTNLWEFLSRRISGRISLLDENTETEIITLCRPYIEGVVELCTRRIDLCILHFPDAIYSKTSRDLVEETLNNIISFDDELLSILKPSIRASKINFVAPANPLFAQPKPLFAQPNPLFAQLKPPFAQPNPLFAQAKPLFAQPKPEPDDPARKTYETTINSAHAQVADTSVPKSAESTAREESPQGHSRHGSDQSSKAEEYETKGRERLERGRIWNHLTISRDQTSASDFTKEFLAKLFGIRLQDQEDEHTAPGPEPEGPLNLRNPQEVATHRQRIAYEQRLLEQQRLRLHFLRKVKSQNPIPQPANELGSDSLDTSQTEMHTVTTDKEMHVSQEADLIETESSRLAGPVQENPNSKKGDNLLARIALLEQENKALRMPQSSAFRYQKLHFIRNENPKPGPNAPAMTGYLDEPNWVNGPNGDAALRSNLPITDINGFLRRNSGITFTVAYYYTPSVQAAEVAKALLLKKCLPRPVPTSEFITLHDKEMIAAMESFLAMQPNFSDEFPTLEIRGKIPAPYLFWYHYRSSNALGRLSPELRDVMKFFTSWIEENYAKKYALAEDHFAKGIVSCETMPFLVKPGDVLVWEGRREVHAAVAQDWLKQSSAPAIHQSNKEKEINWSQQPTVSNTLSAKWSAESWNFEFDGEFHRKQTTIDIMLDIDEESNIDKLNKYPLKYASPRIKACLERRGKTFWKCRRQHLVSYDGEGAKQTTGERFMVDYKTYQQLHSSSVTVTAKFPRANRSIENFERLGSEVMENDDPPPSPDIYVFPDTIPGYNLHTKKWVDLKVDLIKDVKWNKESFQHLVVEHHTKELIQALVKHQIASEQGTDIVDRKGNGLIILLHGGPGTGKTFTAESVAELAEKPLFRVTCGDIGTKPEDVEKYLDSVLYLGKIWNCIVLIDEAEVFLEQRSLDNLERNALVSVFLRVLEYYEGILILTSNRVGTFDEAFKSRVLLSLHYENLTEGQRTQIWTNMFRRLEDIGSGDKDGVSATTEPGSRKRKARDEANTVGIDFVEVNCYIRELAKQNLNGRQIRNAITTARQLATFRNEQMGYRHLQHVIEVSSKFDRYLDKLQGPADQVARDEGFR